MSQQIHSYLWSTENTHQNIKRPWRKWYTEGSKTDIINWILQDTLLLHALCKVILCPAFSVWSSHICIGEWGSWQRHLQKRSISASQDWDSKDRQLLQQLRPLPHADGSRPEHSIILIEMLSWDAGSAFSNSLCFHQFQTDMWMYTFWAFLGPGFFSLSCMILYRTNSYWAKIGTYGLHRAETEAHFSEAGTGFQ